MSRARRSSERRPSEAARRGRAAATLTGDARPDDRALDTATTRGRELCRRPHRPPTRRVDHRQDPAGSKASPPARAKGSASASSSTARGASPRRHRLDAAEIDRVAAEAVRIARASATALRDRVRLDDRPPAHGTFETPVVEDPFTVPLEAKIGDLLAADEATEPGQRHRLHRVDRTPRSASGRPSPPGRQLHRADDHPRRRRASRPTRSTATSTSAGATRTRAAAGRRAGYEYVRGLDLLGHAEALAEEAVALLTAPQCPSGRRTIVLDPSQLYLQVHEIVRPPDRARPGLRDRGLLRRHELPDDRQARRRLPLRLGPGRRSSPTRRPRAAWARSAGTTRASPPRRCRSSRTASSSAT